MFYTHCYEEDKLCKDKLKKLFEDVLKSFENKEQRDKEEKLRPAFSTPKKNRTN